MNNSEITILNVDGGEASLHVKSDILREVGYRVVEARTGADAMRSLAQHRPQMVLLSVDLPDQSGLDVCRQIKTWTTPFSKEASPPVLLVSGTFVGCEERARSLEEGADGYLLEPITPEFLIANIRTLLRRAVIEQADEGLVAEERRQAWVMEKMALGALGINSAESLDEILQIMTDEARDLIGAHQAVTSLTSDFSETGAQRQNEDWPRARNVVSLSEKHAGCNDRRLGAWVCSLVCRLNQPMRLTQAELDSQFTWRPLENETDGTDGIDGTYETYETYGTDETHKSHKSQASRFHPKELEDVVTPRELMMLRELATLGEVAALGSEVTPRERAMLRKMAALREPRILRGLEMRGWLAAPLTARDGRNLGLIQLSDKYEGEFTEQDEATLAQLARISSIAIENRRLFHREQRRRLLAENALRAKDEFLAMVSHRLRAPLNTLLGWAWVLRRQTADADGVARAAEIIERAARAQTQLVEDLMKTSHVITGALEEQDRLKEGEKEGNKEEETESIRGGEIGYLSVPSALYPSISSSMRPSVQYSPGAASRGMAASSGC
ncbi:MAG TPA: response regulator [Blastocatellia bacterium]|nr:response regulator [Blastocatellia bacterium]